MKTVSAALTALYASSSPTFATALRLTRSDGTVRGFTSHHIDVVISGVTYSATPGLLVSSIVTTAGLEVGNLELSTLDDGTIFTRAEILNNLWDNAGFVLFRYNHSPAGSPSEDSIDTLLAGSLGEVTLLQGMIRAELRDLRQMMQYPVGGVSSKTCRARLGDARCKVSLTGSPTATGTEGGVTYSLVSASIVTSVTSNRIFTASGRTEPSEWFDEGEVVWTSGLNTGAAIKVREFVSGGTFALVRACAATVQVGDRFTAIAGCQKTLETCRDKFNNVINFVGEPHRRGLNDLVKGA